MKSDFLKSVLVLTSGTVLAQLISLIATPIISRYFGPEQNAYLGLFLKITSVSLPTKTDPFSRYYFYHKKQYDNIIYL